MAIYDIPSVDRYSSALRELLLKAQTIKPAATIEPPLTSLDFGVDLDRVGSGKQQYAAIETACRDLFYDILYLSREGKTSFSQIWNLLDIITIFSDNGQCDPTLIFWLVEELLDSQTIEGCKVVFDYLESRRERLVTKNFHDKHLVILRSCNQLLRRLSRAEDTVFCGRVFIFMFQSFPLGDRSSINLRGEFHVENVTVYDILSGKSVEEGKMEVDSPQQKQMEETAANSKAVASPVQRTDTLVGAEQASSQAKSMAKDVNPEKSVELMDMDSLYPIFWSLQKSFSQPVTLFDPESFQSFKDGLKVTIARFKVAQKSQEGRGVTSAIDAKTKGLKRKRGDENGDQASGFNPKYLTSRDLFELEISDLAFRRYILVQALILIDFLLSLTSDAKEKLLRSNPTNKSVLYPWNLSKDDEKWANETKLIISNHLKEAPDGNFYYRMVETVLSRDKNWVQWKALGCPAIDLSPFPPGQYQEALNGMKSVATTRRLRSQPMGAVDVSFLRDNTSNSLEALRDVKRYKIPTVEELQIKILDDEFDIDMTVGEEKEAALAAKASKTWRALRIASKNRLRKFNKIDENANNLRPLTEPDVKEAEAEVSVEEEKASGEEDKIEETADHGQERGVEVSKLGDEVMTEAPEIKVDPPGMGEPPGNLGSSRETTSLQQPIQSIAET